MSSRLPHGDRDIYQTVCAAIGYHPDRLFGTAVCADSQPSTTAPNCSTGRTIATMRLHSGISCWPQVTTR
jgi:hypothetical protein